MNIILISPECSPFASFGYIGDFVYKHAQDLEKSGHNVKVFIPRYGFIDPAIYHVERIPQDFKIPFNNSSISTSVYKGILPDSLTGLYLIESQNYFSNSKEIYLDQNTNDERFKFFCQATIDVISKLKLEADIIHLFGSHIVSIAKLPRSKNTGLVFTITNLIDEAEKTSTIDAIKHCNVVITVSKAYRDELLEGIAGAEIANTLTSKKDDFLGISFNIDQNEYNSETDESIIQAYSKSYFSAGKRKCKENLLEISNLTSNMQLPLIGTIYTGTEKIIFDLIPEISSLGSQFIVLNKSKNNFEQYKNIKTINNIDKKLERQLFAGCDFFVNLSHTEPSGFYIMLAMKYGCIPISYFTGRAKEIIDNNNGIMFKEYTCESLLRAIEQGISIYKNKELWTKMVKQAMSYTYNDQESIKEYIMCYEKALNNKVTA